MSGFPNFFIVGAARAGTTSFSRYLAGHPDVYMSPVKEPHFFATEVDPEKFRDGFPRREDPGEYFKTHPLQPTGCIYVRESKQYEQLFACAEGQAAIGEASVSYLYSKTAARRIREASPGARILIFLRNPIDRAYSHYLIDHPETSVTSEDFLQAVARDDASPKKGWGISNLYVELGLYFEQVKRFQDAFPPEQVKVLFYDDYQQDTRKAMADICDFLGLRMADPDSIAYDWLNRSHRIPQFPSIISRYRRTPIVRLGRSLPSKLKEAIWTGLSRAREPLTADARRRMASYFREDLAKLSGIVGRDLTHWTNC